MERMLGREPQSLQGASGEAGLAGVGGYGQRTGCEARGRAEVSPGSFAMWPWEEAWELTRTHWGRGGTRSDGAQLVTFWGGEPVGATRSKGTCESSPPASCNPPCQAEWQPLGCDRARSFRVPFQAASDPLSVPVNEKLLFQVPQV